jgi:flagellar hook capping protein FlgD
MNTNRPIRIACVASVLCCAMLASARSYAQSDAFLILIDRSASMVDVNKWVYAQQAVVQAFDQDAFDAFELGLISAPNGPLTGPACIFNLPVDCQVPVVPDVSIAPAGPKSTSPGQRRTIKDWLATHSPSSFADAMPLYGAMESAIGALQSWSGTGRRILLVITDGGISCGQITSRPGYGDCNGCDHEWETPLNITALAAAANADLSKPVDTFVIGLPGAGSYDPSGCTFPPYHMRLALSAIAHAGSPNRVPDNCGGTFTQGGLDPLINCHFDLPILSSAQTLVDAIAAARDAALATVAVPRLDPADGSRVPHTLTLAAPWPNPARSWARLRFGMPQSGPMRLAIHDVSGRLVRKLASGGLDAGSYTLDWDLRDDSSALVASGLYFVRLSAAGVTRHTAVAVFP